MHIDDFIREQALARARLIETASEAAIKGGVCGVKAVYHQGLLVSVDVDPDVPYGELHEHLS